VFATTPFSFISIYLALKTSRNNAVVDLSESKNSEKRDEEKILLFSSSFLIDFFLDDEKFICFFSHCCFPQKNTNLSLSRVLFFFITRFIKRELERRSEAFLLSFL